MFFKLSLLFKTKRKKEEKLIKPSPPVWIKIKIIVFPKSDQWERVSVVVKPVTHVAEVAVKMQSKKFVVFPSLEDIGKNKIKLPNKIIIKKLKQTVLTGFCLKKFFFLKEVVIFLYNLLF